MAEDKQSPGETAIRLILIAGAWGILTTILTGIFAFAGWGRPAGTTFLFGFIAVCVFVLASITYSLIALYKKRRNK